MFEGQAAEAVVAAELYDGDLGMAVEDMLDAVEAVLGGVAGDAVVEDVVVVAGGVEEMLEGVGVGLAGVGAEAGGEGVAEAEDPGSVLRGRRGALRGRRWGWGRCWTGGDGCVGGRVGGRGVAARWGESRQSD